MSKVYLATCYFQENYGSVLQALATQRFLDQHSIENITINYDLIRPEVEKKKKKFYLKNAYKLGMFFGQIARYKIRLVEKIYPHLVDQFEIRKRKFQDFRTSHFNITEPVDFKSLRSLVQNAKAVLVGSDQLWLPSNIEGDYYTLNFVPEQVKKISYATSFGFAKLPYRQAVKATSFLKRINYLSVRENSGRKLIQELTGLKSQVVCDPTLLLSMPEWAQLIPAKSLIEGPYIFCYFLGNNPDQRKWAAKLREKTGFKIVSLLHMDEYIHSDAKFADIAPYDIDPGDFVNLIRHAEYVCTDSFHGSIFSMLHHKRFFTFRRFMDKSSASTNSRIYSLLQKFNLTGRMVDSSTPLDSISEIDYKQVDSKIAEYRNESASFLMDALQDK